ncbi:Glycerate dehydrogenase [Quillaja saponaria]|uniref:Glycerate dehydrogenase n=1 Tax=Quillaja saponaria TaxID=32244 RepID=A0AAD7QBS7_QUISA|nr:Glycerate dehydrogenase [Quillaja saponaria]
MSLSSCYWIKFEKKVFIFDAHICTQKKTILSVEDIIALIGDKSDGVIGQLTEDWEERLFSALSKAGGGAFSNMAVGYNNVDVNAANKYGVAVGNTPGVLTETTAELAASLSIASSSEAILINCSRGSVVDEVALVEHLKENPMFRVGVDVSEDEPYLKPGLADLKNAIIVPHIASASKWTRGGMATLAALNVLGNIRAWSDPNRVEPFLNENASPPAACPSIVNAKALGNMIISGTLPVRLLKFENPLIRGSPFVTNCRFA